MAPMPLPDEKYPSQTGKGCVELRRNLDAGLAIPTTNRKVPTLTELRAKSLPTMLRNEIDEAARSVGP